MRWALVVVLTVAYPALVYFSLGHWEPRWAALLLLGLALLRALCSQRSDPFWWWATAAAALLAACSALFNQSMPLKMYPVAVNAGLALLFGMSLVQPPSLVERIARRMEPRLNAAGVRYTRRVTQVWCGFFIVNGGLALLTALAADDRTWVLYNGFVAYVLIGALMAGEWLVRQRVRALHVAGPDS